jgi:hypothetical protein
MKYSHQKELHTKMTKINIYAWKALVVDLGFEYERFSDKLIIHGCRNISEDFANLLTNRPKNQRGWQIQNIKFIYEYKQYQI